MDRGGGQSNPSACSWCRWIIERRSLVISIIKSWFFLFSVPNRWRSTTWGCRSQSKPFL